MTYNAPTPAPSDRVRWDDAAHKQLAADFIEARKIDPFSSSLDLLKEAIKKLPEHLRRDINTWSAVPHLRVQIGNQWLEETTRANPEPVVVHVESQRAPDYVDLLHNLDMPSLVALVVAKLGKELDGLKPLLTVLNGANGNGNGKVGTPLNPPISLLAAASSKPRKTRVLICGPRKSVFVELESRAKEQNIPVDLQFMDNDHAAGRHVPVTTDYVIGTAALSHQQVNVFKKAVPEGRWFMIGQGNEPGQGMTAILNKLRDIGTLLPPRA